MRDLTRRSSLFLAITAALYGAQATAAMTEAETQELNQLRFQVKQLQLINKRQAETLQKLDSRLLNLEQPATPASGITSTSSTTATSTVTTSTPTQAQTPAATASAAGAEEEVKKEAAPSQSVENFLQEEHALFSRPLTLQFGFSYSHYDRKELVLDGFLALDAIFLGAVSVDNVESDILTFDIGARYNLTDRWQVGIRAPFVSRWTNYTKDPQAGTPDPAVEADVSETMELGDVELSTSYKLHTEAGSWPDTVWSLRVRAPTGRDPYGIKQVEQTIESTTLLYPGEVATGSGVWAAATGFSFVKTTDPAILFANIEYTHHFEESFNDISSVQGVVTPGDVRLGDAIGYGLGVAFAINDRMSMSFSYSQRYQTKSETRAQGGSWNEVTHSDANAATFNTGVTYALGPKWAMSTSLGIGLTPDAPDFTLSVNFPYSF
ncbi:MAG: hypothetical protein OIF57_17785 [Marinobacterium sp.]|nr:hypothetical protein [Marinobacterium sp.]